MAAGLHISISAEKLFNVGGLDITNSMFTSIVISILIITFAITVKSKLQNTSKPKGIQNFAEMIVESLFGLVHGVTGNLKKTRIFFPFIATFFIVILLNNWVGLIPGVGTIKMIVKEETEQHEAQADSNLVYANEDAKEEKTIIEHEDTTTIKHEETEELKEETIVVDHKEEASEETAVKHEEVTKEHEIESAPLFRASTADINTTLSLAIASLFLTQLFGIKYLKFSYFKKFINFSSPIMFFVGILELISEFAKIISFAFRLFGNIFAGEVLLVVMAFLFPVILPMPFYGLEIFVGFIQALVFSMLTLVFFNMATISHDEH